MIWLQCIAFHISFLYDALENFWHLMSGLTNKINDRSYELTKLLEYMGLDTQDCRGHNLGRVRWVN